MCLVPMMVATLLGHPTYLVTLGQGAFFFSSIFLPGDSARAWFSSSSSGSSSSSCLGLGLEFYLIGGTVAPNHSGSSSAIEASDR